MKKSLFISCLLSLGFIVSAQITSPAPYCIANFDDDPFNVPDAIFGVTLGTLNNQSNSQNAFPHYIFYNNLSAPSLQKGSTYTLSAKFDVQGGVGIGVWIDYNHNNTFELSEKILNNPSAGVPIALTTQTVSFTIPTSALTGTTRMRVRIVEDDNFNIANNFVILSCNASTSTTDVMDWGETEDYNVNITSVTNISEQELSSQILIFPNPTENELSISTSNDIMIRSVLIKNIHGETIHLEFNYINNIITSNVSNLSSGIYFLEVLTNYGVAYHKLIKN